MSHSPSISPDLQRHIDVVLKTTMPTGHNIGLAAALIKRWFKPTFVGLERLPSKPALFVGNHSLLAVDGFVFWTLMNYDYGRFLRALGDKSLFANPQYASVVTSLGAGLGRPEVFEALMTNKQDILLFPGGTHEAIKSPERRYELMWQERYGFIRMAAKMGYTIVPFASVGPDEYFEHYIEGPEIMATELAQLLIRLGLIPDDLRDDIVPPLPAGVFGSLIPKPKTTYFGFGRPVDLAAYAGKIPTKRQQQKLRDSVADEIDQQIKSLLLLREQRRHKDSLLRRILSI